MHSILSFSRSLQITIRALPQKIFGHKQRVRKNIAHCERNFQLNTWQKNTRQKTASSKSKWPRELLTLAIFIYKVGNLRLRAEPPFYFHEQRARLFHRRANRQACEKNERGAALRF
jgi:hypothetical protein